MSKTHTFEQAVGELEQIIKVLESGETSLDSAFSQYKHGMELIQFCQDKLRTIEQKVKILDQDHQQLVDFAIE
jgi:exodeoxyribonuclease VII small subunit